VSAPLYLIAEREFRTYVATVSFWLALALGPLAMAALAALVNQAQAPIQVAVESNDASLQAAGAEAIEAAASAEGRRFTIRQHGAATLSLHRRADGAVEANFDSDFPLSGVGRNLVRRTIERDEAVRRLRAAGENIAPIVVQDPPEILPPAHSDEGRLSRLALMGMLWLTLTGSIGLLLQAVVRERTNRALEILLAVARPWEIVIGKLLGISAISGLVLAAWLGSAAMLGNVGPAVASQTHSTIFGLLAQPAALMRAVILYVLAYAFYGLLTIGLGAGARDSAVAQNLSRPVFALLLISFFLPLMGVSASANTLYWLRFLPPFTPFILLLDAHPGFAASDILPLGLLSGAILVGAYVSVRRLSIAI